MIKNPSRIHSPVNFHVSFCYQLDLCKTQIWLQSHPGFLTVKGYKYMTCRVKVSTLPSSVSHKITLKFSHWYLKLEWSPVITEYSDFKKKKKKNSKTEPPLPYNHLELNLYPCTTSGPYPPSYGPSDTVALCSHTSLISVTFLVFKGTFFLILVF